ncbi:PepSY domain-containing protein [Streptomyces phaeofaciens]|uniref:PepSY domain-containing protein n=1 Tax=Streptomyces phaeofaciens TaxID=68254 RepID=UPI0036BF4DD4
MKRKLVIAAVATSLVLGSGAAIAFADGAPGTAGTSPRSEVKPASGAAKTEVTEAIAAALEHTPGTAVAAEREDDGADAGTWQVDVVRADATAYTVTVSPDTGKVLGAHRDSDDDGREDLTALRSTTVDAREAARAVAPEGTVTEVDLDDDEGATAWSVDTATSGAWTVDARTGKATQDRDD